MGKMPDALRETIARNIRFCRMRQFPGRGGGKRCAESFGVSPQQWSPWESGKRTPDELRLEQIANFFGTTVEWFRRDHRQESGGNALAPSLSTGETDKGGFYQSHVFGDAPRPLSMLGEGDVNEMTAHYVMLIEHLTRRITANGIKIVVTFEKAPTGNTVPGV